MLSDCHRQRARIKAIKYPASCRASQLTSCYFLVLHSLLLASTRSLVTSQPAKEEKTELKQQLEASLVGSYSR